MQGRRKFLGAVGATAVAVGAWRKFGRPAAEATAEHASLGTPAGSKSVAVHTATSDSLEMLAEAGVRAGARFRTCEVVSVTRTEDGAVAVQLADAGGERFEVELLGRDALTPGVAHAGPLGVYMNNRGRGTKATVEEHGLAAMTLAARLAQRAAAGAVLPSLPTLSNRVATSALV
jgi:hypothetical protein